MDVGFRLFVAPSKIIDGTRDFRNAIAINCANFIFVGNKARQRMIALVLGLPSGRIGMHEGSTNVLQYQCQATAFDACHVFTVAR